MTSYKQRIEELEQELKKTKYNKATQHHIGLTKAKLARFKDKEISRSGKKGQAEGFSERKTGDATVVLVGMPSVGKSTLLNAITNADSKTAGYAFTTVTVIPGLLDHKGAKIQILDLPGIISGASRGAGRGREIISILQNADMLLLMVDVKNPSELDTIKKELYEANIRINQDTPNVVIKRAQKGGIQLSSTVKLTKVNVDTIKDVAKEYRFHNCTIIIRENIDIDQFIDVLEGSRRYIPAITLLSKIDSVSEEVVKKATAKINPEISISSAKKIGLGKLKDKIFQKLSFIRIYTKEVGKKADMSDPLILKKGSTIKTVCGKLHRGFENRFRFARVWGKSAKFPGQRFQLVHEVKDGDIIQLHLR